MKCPQNIAQLRQGVVLGRKVTYQGDTCPLDTRAPPRKHLPLPTLPRRPAANSMCRVSGTLQGCKTPQSQSQPECLEIISSNFSAAEIQSPGPLGSSYPGGMDDADRPHVGKQRPASQVRLALYVALKLPMVFTLQKGCVIKKKCHRDRMWATKPKVLTIWSLMGKAGQPLLQTIAPLGPSTGPRL